MTWLCLSSGDQSFLFSGSIICSDAENGAAEGVNHSLVHCCSDLYCSFGKDFCNNNKKANSSVLVFHLLEALGLFHLKGQLLWGCVHAEALPNVLAQPECFFALSTPKLYQFPESGKKKPKNCKSGIPSLKHLLLSGIQIATVCGFQSKSVRKCT